MQIPAEEHRSPDGLLRFAVTTLDDTDVAIGFPDFPWHTHADMLAAMRGQSEPAAVREFVDDVLCDRAVIALWFINDELKDVWISDDPLNDLKHIDPNERMEFRYWSGATHVPDESPVA